jgi:hypothetical protein
MLSAGPAPPPPPWRWRYHGCIPLNDWYHLLRKAMEGQFAKKMRDRSNDAFVMRCLNNLRSMPTVAAFECLAKITLAVWTEMDEGGFADYFRRIYLTDPWKNWFLGAMPLGCTSGQQSIEAGHRGDKKILGHAALKAAPEVFLAESVPKILARAGITLDEHPPELMTLAGSGPARAMVIYQAQLLISAASNTPLFRLEDDANGNAYWGVNRGVDDTRKMTKHRAELYGSLYDDGTLPLPARGQRCDQQYYESLDASIFSAVVIVKASKVSSRHELRSWAQQYGTLYGVGPCTASAEELSLKSYFWASRLPAAGSRLQRPARGDPNRRRAGLGPEGALVRLLGPDRRKCLGNVRGAVEGAVLGADLAPRQAGT